MSSSPPTNPISIRFTEKQLQTMDEIKAKTGLTKGSIVKVCVEAFLRDYRTNPSSMIVAKWQSVANQLDSRHSEADQSMIRGVAKVAAAATLPATPTPAPKRRPMAESEALDLHRNPPPLAGKIAAGHADDLAAQFAPAFRHNGRFQPPSRHRQRTLSEEVLRMIEEFVRADYGRPPGQPLSEDEKEWYEVLKISIAESEGTARTIMARIRERRGKRKLSSREVALLKPFAAQLEPVMNPPRKPEPKRPRLSHDIRESIKDAEAFMSLGRLDK